MLRIFSHISDFIWYNKYRFGNEKTPNDTFTRVADAIGENKTERDMFRDILVKRKFMPGGRILSNAGTDRKKVIFSNCNVLPNPKDSMEGPEGILEVFNIAMMVTRQGGGIGLCFDYLRPSGEWVKGIGSISGGPIPFYELFDVGGSIIYSAGLRRLAILASLFYAHPDIMKFVTAKSEGNKLTHCNLSVKVTKELFDRAKENKNVYLFHWVKQEKNKDANFINIEDHVNPYSVITQADIDKNKNIVFLWRGEYYKIKIHAELKAKDLVNNILKHAYDHAEPGLLFIDTINKYNNLFYCENISVTNPCGEQPLAAYGNCVLGSINLTQHIKDREFDFTGFVDTAVVATKFMNRVVEKALFPQKEFADENNRTRRIGLGFTGLADTLAILKLKYGSKESIKFIDRLMSLYANTAYKTSSLLVHTHKTFPAFSNKYLDSKYLQVLDDDTKQQIKKKGLVNSHLISIAPTGTLSLLLGNVSSGIEPIFAAKYTRNVRCDQNYNKKVVLNNGEMYLCMSNEIESINDTESIEDIKLKKQPNGNFVYSFEVQDWAVEKYPGIEDEDTFVTVDDLKVNDHLDVLKIVQKWTDSGISKTLNLPNDYPFDDIVKLIDVLYDAGIKGFTFYREGTLDAILEKKPEKKENELSELQDKIKELERQLGQYDKTFKRPVRMNSRTWQIKFIDYTAMVTIGEINRRPREIILNMGRGGSVEHALSEALGRALSKLLQTEMDLKDICKSLIGVKDGNVMFHKMYDKQEKPVIIKSLPDAIGKILVYNYLDQDRDSGNGIRCPRCFLNSVFISEGCKVCKSCGYSKCDE